MEAPRDNLQQVLAAAKELAGRALSIGGNRLELLILEAQDECAHRLHLFLLGVGVGAFSLLAALSFSALLVVALWAWSPVAVLLVLTLLYLGIALGLYWWLTRQLREWRMFSASLDQLRKDRAGLESLFA